VGVAYVDGMDLTLNSSLNRVTHLWTKRGKSINR